MAAADLRSTDHVLEVGPGLGSLTLGLLDAVAAVTAVEIDPPLAQLLPRTVAEHAPHRAKALQVITADALRVGAGDLPGDPPTALVANLPYNVAVPVLLHLLAEVPTLRRVLVMVQAEVADRLVAGPGSKIYGSPSVKTAWYGTARRAGSIGRSVFWPVPGVDSALVAFTRRDPPAVDVPRADVFAVVDAAFSQRRKTLRAALATWAGSAAAAERIRARPGWTRARGESLGVAGFARIAAAARAGIS